MLNQQLANELYKPITKTFNIPSFKYMVCRPSWYAVNK